MYFDALEKSTEFGQREELQKAINTLDAWFGARDGHLVRVTPEHISGEYRDVSRDNVELVLDYLVEEGPPEFQTEYAVYCPDCDEGMPQEFFDDFYDIPDPFVCKLTEKQFELSGECIQKIWTFEGDKKEKRERAESIQHYENIIQEGNRFKDEVEGVMLVDIRQGESSATLHIQDKETAARAIQALSEIQSDLVEKYLTE